MHTKQSNIGVYFELRTCQLLVKLRVSLNPIKNRWKLMNQIIKLMGFGNYLLKLINSTLRSNAMFCGFYYVKVWVSNDFLRGFSWAVTSNFCCLKLFNTLKLMSSSSAIVIDIKHLVIDEGPIWYCHCCSAKNNSLWICDNCQLKNEAKVNWNIWSYTIYYFDMVWCTILYIFYTMIYYTMFI